MMRRFLAWLLLALGLPLWQAWAAIGTPVNIASGNGSAGTTLALTTTATANAGETILVVCSATTAVTAVADSASNSYTQDNTATNTVITNLWRSTNIAQLTSGGTITATKGNGISTSCAALSVSGLANVSPVDVTGTPATGTSATPSASATTTNADDLVVGTVGWSGGVTLTQDGAWTGLTGVAATNANVGWAYRIVSATGTYTYAPTLSGAANWVDFVMGYKAAAGGAPQRTMTGVGQ